MSPCGSGINRFHELLLSIMYNVIQSFRTSGVDETEVAFEDRVAHTFPALEDPTLV
jgi:hypothetical protein